MQNERTGKYRGKQMNPLPASVFPCDNPATAPGASGMDILAQGFEVLDQSQPRHSWNPDRRGLLEPILTEGADREWDRTRYGTLT